MRVVKKNEIKTDTFIQPDGLAICLDCWKSWMLTDDRDLSASRMKLHGGADDDKDRERRGYESDPYEEQRKADMRVGEATNAMIDSLKPAWRWAIYRKCGITTVWNFPALDWMSVIQQAEAELEQKLRRNIATATQF
jgi:hypothetical protein